MIGAGVFSLFVLTVAQPTPASSLAPSSLRRTPAVVVAETAGAAVVNISAELLERTNNQNIKFV